MDWSPGDKISEQLRLVRPLSSADPNKVWLADQLFWHKQVVVKFVPTELPPEDGEALAELAEEAARARSLQSKHVAPTLAYGVAPDGSPYVLLEPLKGETLRASLREHGPMEGRLARNIVRQIAEAVGEAHEQGFIHGALSTDNVFLCKGVVGPDVKVLNLGVAAVVPRVHSDYVSPEYYLGKDADARSDVWSLGVIGYEMLTGQRPFDQENRLMLSWHFVSPSELLPDGAPEDLDAFFERVFAQVPDDRYGSMEETAKAFSEAVLSPKRRPSVVEGVRPSRISRHHVLDVEDRSPGSRGSDDDRER